MNREEFTKSILSCEEMLYRISMSMLKNEKDCEDAVQTAILKAYEKLSTLKNEEYFKTWLVRILINICNKQLKLRSKTVVTENYNQIGEPEEDLELRMLVESLPIKIRQVVVLYYIEQFTTKEISGILKIPKGTVLSRLSKGRELLKLEFL